MTLPVEVVRKCIRDKCRECAEGVGGAAKCDCKECFIHKYRPGKRAWAKNTLLSAIRRECGECVGTDLDICTSPNCAFYPLRMGRWSSVYTEFVMEWLDKAAEKELI